MKRTLLAVSVCLSVSPALATDWALNSTLSQTVELNDNPFLRAVAAGTLSSYSTILANATARTPTSKFSFDGNISYQKYWGPGVDGIRRRRPNLEVRGQLEHLGHARFEA